MKLTYRDYEPTKVVCDGVQGGQALLDEAGPICPVCARQLDIKTTRRGGFLYYQPSPGVSLCGVCGVYCHMNCVRGACGTLQGTYWMQRDDSPTGFHRWNWCLECYTETVE